MGIDLFRMWLISTSDPWSSYTGTPKGYKHNEYVKGRTINQLEVCKPKRDEDEY